MEIAKAHSLGNDFLVIRRDGPPGEGRDGDLARKICDRHTGAGADGLLFISVEDAASGRVSFHIFNADGSEAEISGNGVRCAAATLYRAGAIKGPRIQFDDDRRATAPASSCRGTATSSRSVWTWACRASPPRRSRSTTGRPTTGSSIIP